MPRPKRCRKICSYPDYWSFAPEEIIVDETTPLTLDEFETLRLIDYQKMTQEECAAAMGVSRTTVTGIYERARFKLADAMVNGKRIRITGGSYQVDPIWTSAKMKEKGENIMRIAVTYEDGMVGQHFGRTEQFIIYDIDGKEITASQVIDTNGTGHGALAGFLHAADADILICGGIGMGARNALEEIGIRLLPGVTGNAEHAVKSYLTGELVSNPDEVCRHHEHGKDHDCDNGFHNNHSHDCSHNCGHNEGCGTHGNC